MQKIYLGADHGGFELKEQLKSWLEEIRYSVEDLGAFSYNPDDDYPEFASAVANKVATEGKAIGILICRSGGGMVITANKIYGIRAVELFDKKSAKHAREHNHANVITIGADWTDLNQAKEIITEFLNTEPSQEERHLRRLDQIAKLEK
mgnify:CR=1 FL=1